MTEFRGFLEAKQKESPEEKLKTQKEILAGLGRDKTRDQMFRQLLKYFSEAGENKII